LPDDYNTGVANIESFLSPEQGIKSWNNEGFRQAPGVGKFGAESEHSIPVGLCRVIR